MISNHKSFIEALQEKRKVTVRFYSYPDSGVVDRVCAPLDYGLGCENKDGLNRYWLWDYANEARIPLLGLLPDQVVDLQLLGAVFDPAHLDCLPEIWSIPRSWGAQTIPEEPSATAG